MGDGGFRRTTFGSALLAVCCALLTACAGLSPHLLTSSHAAQTPPTLTGDIRHGVTIPFWQRTFTYAGTNFTASFVGADPALGASTTVVPTEIIPLVLTFSSGASTDGTSAAAIVAASPLYVKTKFRYEKTQYGDAVVREEFAGIEAAQPYDVLLGSPAIEAPMSVAVPAADGYTKMHNGQVEGFLDSAYFLKTVEPAVIGQLNLPSTALAVFVTTRTQLIEPDGKCCYYGFHQALVTKTPTGKATYTTVWGSALPGEVSMLSHEMAEWLADPFDDNVVPGWVNPQTGSCESDKLEVGDPLVNVGFHQAGYQLQDIAFYSWFSRDAPSIGLNGQYDFLGHLTAPAGVCTPSASPK